MIDHETPAEQSLNEVQRHEISATYVRGDDCIIVMGLRSHMVSKIFSPGTSALFDKGGIPATLEEHVEIPPAIINWLTGSAQLSHDNRGELMGEIGFRATCPRA